MSTPPIAAPGSDAATVDRVIRDRHTFKLLADRPLDVATDRDLVDAIVASAGWAPFHLLAAREHREGSALPGIVPWRIHLLDVAACRALRGWLLAREDGSTYPRLLAACTALAMATWLPETPSAPLAESHLFAGTRENMEHVAAAAAAVQNLLLAATARGVRTFWSTGGPMRTADALAHLGIGGREILLGAVFLFPSEAQGAETKVSTVRDRRGAPAEWSRWVALEEGPP